MDLYKKIYNNFFFEKSDGINEWNHNILKFGSNYAAALYAHNINYLSIFNHFKLVDFPEGKDGSTNYKIKDQIDYINDNKKRIPKNILEVAGGRGELSIFLNNLNYKVTSIEFQENAKEWYDRTSLKYFNKIHSVNLINKNIKDVEINLKKFDTIIICESIEHFPKEHFENFYQNIKENFKGYFIITNWPSFWPLPAINNIHCRTINNKVYDDFVTDAKKLIFRYKSHICIEY
jgi:hypothetical protein